MPTLPPDRFGNAIQARHLSGATHQTLNLTSDASVRFGPVTAFNRPATGQGSGDGSPVPGLLTIVTTGMVWYKIGDSSVTVAPDNGGLLLPGEIVATVNGGDYIAFYRYEGVGDIKVAITQQGGVI